MIVTKDFVFVHTFRCGGTFISEGLKEHYGGVEVGYHLPYSEVPKEYAHLPVIGVVRNPWDWYLSVYYHCLNFHPVMKTNSVVNHITNYSSEPFRETLLKLIDTQWMADIDVEKALCHLPEEYDLEGSLTDNILKAELGEYLTSYDTGLYSWFLDRMYKGAKNLHICKTESLALDFFRATEALELAIPTGMVEYLIEGKRCNEMKSTNSYTGAVPLPRAADYSKYYEEETKDIVYSKDRAYIEQLRYTY